MSMKVRVERWSDFRPELTLLWRDMRRDNPALASPYFHPRFAGIVAASNPPHPVEVATIYDKGEIAAFLPFHRLENNIGVPVGHFLNDYQGLICRPSFRCDLDDVIEACGLSIFDFDHAVTSQRCFAPFTRSVDPSPQIDLSIGDYLTTQKAVKSERIKIRRIEKKLGPLRLVTHSTDPIYWMQFCSWKSEQYMRTNVTNIFWVRWVQRVLEQVRDAQDKDFSGMFSMLFAGPHFVAAHFGIRSGPLLHSWFPAYDPLLSTYSPGLLLLIKLFEVAPELGITKVDLGKGMYEWKQRLMNASEDVASGSVELLSVPTLKRIARRGAGQIARRVGLRA